jgi:hypothetical protein
MPEEYSITSTIVVHCLHQYPAYNVVLLQKSHLAKHRCSHFTHCLEA